MPRLVYFTGLALILVAGAFLLTRELTWQPGVTAGNVARIRKGMTMEEVEALMGGKADRAESLWGVPAAVWDGRQGWVTVFFRATETDAPGGVTGAWFETRKSGPGNPLRRAFGPGE
jgi:hypothetical protein